MDRQVVSATVEIYGKKLGADQPVFIIGEAGSNHNGNLETALTLIDVAAEAKADAVKFQTFLASRLYLRGAGTSDYLGDARPIYDIIESMEMNQAWLPTLRDRAHRHGLAFISSPFHDEAVELLHPYVDAYKIASYELTHEPLLMHVARSGKPVLISTGAATLREVDAAVRVLRAAGCSNPIVLQCTASYPTPLEAANVRAMTTLAKELNVLAGLSDHTRDPTTAAAAAAALGAVVIEKHFTLSNSLPGPDHAFAVEPGELAQMVQSIRRTELALGSGQKSVQPLEEELRQFARRSIFAIRDISAGERFSRRNVDVLRHGKLEAGLAPGELERVLSCAARRPIAAETPICADDLTPLKR